MSESKQHVNMHLVIGDPHYFDEEGKSKHPHLTVDTVLKDVDISLSFTENDTVPIAIVHLVPHGRTPDLEINDDLEVHITPGMKHTFKELGCDTACYDINDMTIHTASDGFYGYYIETEKGEALVMVDGGYMAESMDAFQEKIRYVFIQEK